MGVTILDGPIGTQLIARGVPAPEPEWSAWATEHAPAEVSALHAEYAAAGATVHRANTFRAKRRSLGDGWESAARQAVALARGALPLHHRLAGSIAPLEDCYRPDLSPAEPQAEHREVADVLVDAGVDLLLCETFPHAGEALAAVRASVATGAETWVSLTAGPSAGLMTPAVMGKVAGCCVDAGASACLVNCVPAVDSLRFLAALCELPVPVGVCANAGAAANGLGWGAPEGAAERYADLADRWIAVGATIIGSCCGTGPEHIAALARRYG